MLARSLGGHLATTYMNNRDRESTLARKLFASLGEVRSTDSQVLESWRGCLESVLSCAPISLQTHSIGQGNKRQALVSSSLSRPAVFPSCTACRGVLLLCEQRWAHVHSVLLMQPARVQLWRWSCCKTNKGEKISKTGEENEQSF